MFIRLDLFKIFRCRFALIKLFIKVKKGYYIRGCQQFYRAGLSRLMPPYSKVYRSSIKVKADLIIKV